MADGTVVHIGENSPEEVALKLFQEVAHAEKKDLWRGVSQKDTPDRKWILDTYAECLATVQAPHGRLRKSNER